MTRKTYKIEVQEAGRTRADGYVKAFRYGAARWSRYYRNSLEKLQALKDCTDCLRETEGMTHYTVTQR